MIESRTGHFKNSFELRKTLRKRVHVLFTSHDIAAPHSAKHALTDRFEKHPAERKIIIDEMVSALPNLNQHLKPYENRTDFHMFADTVMEFVQKNDQEHLGLEDDLLFLELSTFAQLRKRSAIRFAEPIYDAIVTDLKTKIWDHIDQDLQSFQYEKRAQFMDHFFTAAPDLILGPSEQDSINISDLNKFEHWHITQRSVEDQLAIGKKLHTLYQIKQQFEQAKDDSHSRLKKDIPFHYNRVIRMTLQAKGTQKASPVELIDRTIGYLNDIKAIGEYTGRIEKKTPAELIQEANQQSPSTKRFQQEVAELEDVWTRMNKLFGENLFPKYGLEDTLASKAVALAQRANEIFVGCDFDPNVMSPQISTCVRTAIRLGYEIVTFKTSYPDDQEKAILNKLGQSLIAFNVADIDSTDHSDTELVQTKDILDKIYSLYRRDDLIKDDIAHTVNFLDIMAKRIPELSEDSTNFNYAMASAIIINKTGANLALLFAKEGHPEIMLQEALIFTDRLRNNYKKIGSHFEHFRTSDGKTEPKYEEAITIYEAAYDEINEITKNAKITSDPKWGDFMVDRVRVAYNRSQVYSEPGEKELFWEAILKDKLKHSDLPEQALTRLRRRLQYFEQELANPESKVFSDGIVKNAAAVAVSYIESIAVDPSSVTNVQKLLDQYNILIHHEPGTDPADIEMFKDVIRITNFILGSIDPILHNLYDSNLKEAKKTKTKSQYQLLDTLADRTPCLQGGPYISADTYSLQVQYGKDQIPAPVALTSKKNISADDKIIRLADGTAISLKELNPQVYTKQPVLINGTVPIPVSESPYSRGLQYAMEVFSHKGPVSIIVLEAGKQQNAAFIITNDENGNIRICADIDNERNSKLWEQTTIRRATSTEQADNPKDLRGTFQIIVLPIKIENSQESQHDNLSILHSSRKHYSTIIQSDGTFAPKTSTIFEALLGKYERAADMGLPFFSSDYIQSKFIKPKTQRWYDDEHFATKATATELTDSITRISSTEGAQYLPFTDKIEPDNERAPVIFDLKMLALTPDSLKSIVQSLAQYPPQFSSIDFSTLLPVKLRPRQLRSKRSRSKNLEGKLKDS